MEPEPKAEIFYISPEQLPVARLCLEIIGGKVTNHDQRRTYAFSCFIKGTEYIFDKNSLKTLRNKMLQSGYSVKQFHNLFEEALGLPTNSTLL